MIRKTNIVCTLGPASESYDVLKDMVLAGMSVARFNMAHGSYEEHQRRIDVVKAVRDDLGRPVAMMMDIKGPEVRTGRVPHPFDVHPKDTIILTSRDVEAYDNVVPVTYNNIHIDAKVGGQVLLNDGLLELRIDSINGQDLTCTVLTHGKIGDHKNMHFPGVHLNIPFIREKDKRDMDFAIKNNVEYIAASFVSRASEVQQVRRYLDANGGNNINIIAKIENKEIMKEEYGKIIDNYYKEIPFISLYFNSYIILHTDKLKGDFSGNWYNMFYNIDTWYKVI